MGVIKKVFLEIFLSLVLYRQTSNVCILMEGNMGVFFHLPRMTVYREKYLHLKHFIKLETQNKKYSMLLETFDFMVVGDFFRHLIRASYNKSKLQ